MPQSIRFEDAGGIYHGSARGNRRDDIYLDDEDRRISLGTLAEACGLTGWQAHSWVLMSNNYHLCIETPEANLVAGMQWLQNAVKQRFTVRRQKCGRLFGDRYKKSKLRRSSTLECRATFFPLPSHKTVLVRAGIVSPEQGESVPDHAWSSVAGGYAFRRESGRSGFVRRKD